MGRGRSGRVSANTASPQVSKTHPQVTNINAYGDHRLDEPDRVEWLRNTLNTSNSQAEKNEETIYSFTGGGFKAMHNNTNKAGNDIIDAVIDNPLSPVYVGQQFRGLKIYASDMEKGVTPEQFVNNIIKGGVWSEQGATSFSASRGVANSFAGWNGNQNGYISVIVHYPKATTGMPIKHLSRFDYEDEVLHSRKQMTNGYNIINSQWLPGKKKIIITVADR